MIFLVKELLDQQNTIMCYEYPCSREDIPREGSCTYCNRVENNDVQCRPDTRRRHVAARHSRLKTETANQGIRQQFCGILWNSVAKLLAYQGLLDLTQPKYRQHDIWSGGADTV